MAPAGGGDEVGESGRPTKRHRVERSAAAGAKGQSLGVESGSGRSKDPVMSKECLEVRCDDSQRIIEEIGDLKSKLDEDLRQLGYCEENDKLRAELAMKVKEMHCLMQRIELLEAKNDLLWKRTEENDLLRKRIEELEAINDGLSKRNEELHAMNDDLTKQNKELRAKNDCLTKGNEEFQAKNDNLNKNMADEGDCSSEGEKSKSSDGWGLESSHNDESHSSGAADDNNNDEDGIDSGESTETESVTFNTQFSMNKLTKLICGLTKPQKDLIRQCGFGSILDLKCRFMPHKQFIIWLATYYDEKTQCIKIPGTRAFKLDALTVHWILGIPHGGDKIKSKASLDVKYLIANDTHTTPGRLAPKIEDLIAMITPELVGDRFVRIFMLVVLSIFLCPTSSQRVSCLYYEGICSVKKIKSYDWCDAVNNTLQSGLSKFPKYVGKGNISGTAALSGCIFVLFTAYFDYLGTEMNIVPQTIPRIGAWTDEFVHQYMQLDPKFKKMKIKTVGCTVFAKAFLNGRSGRGSCFDALNEPASCAANVAGPSQHKPSKKSTKGPSRALLPENVQIDRDSVQRLIPECTNSGFRVLCGEELHPEVDKYMRYVAGAECSNEVLVHLRNLCQSFFKDSFREYILSVEPVIVSQTCALVRSYMSGLEQSSTQRVSTGPSKDIEVKASSNANTHGSKHMSVHTDKTIGGSSSGKGRDGSGVMWTTRKEGLNCWLQHQT